MINKTLQKRSIAKFIILTLSYVYFNKKKGVLNYLFVYGFSGN